MSFRFRNLTEEVRAKALSELESDIAQGTLYQSARFTSAGKSAYPDLIREALKRHDEAWLTAQLNQGGLIKATETRQTKKGPIQADVPVTAAETFAEGEFNRFYLRGLCLEALKTRKTLEVYRAKQVANARSASELAIGREVDPAALLADLRKNQGIDTHLGLPAGPNSGLSAAIKD